jgi:cytochrome P450
MNRVAYDIATTCLFGAGIGNDADTVAAAMNVLLDDTYRRIGQVADLPLWVPTPANRRFREARKALDEVVYGLIARRRKEGGRAKDVLGLLIGATESDAPGAPGEMSDTALRDQTITLLLSGHETTATALTWTLFLIAKHPEVEARLHREIDERLNGREPGVADLPQLEFTTCVLNESMRLYPPIWILERYAEEADEIGGYQIPKGSTVVISPYTLHRHPAFWPRPDEFDPDRFAAAPESSAAGAFLPFGAGPHHCIGSHFAMLTMRILLAMVGQRFRLRLAPGAEPAPKGGITLRVRDRLTMTAEERIVSSRPAPQSL